MYLLRAKQIGLTLEELDQLEEGIVIDLIIESSNDLCTDEYRTLASQSDMDAF